MTTIQSATASAFVKGMHKSNNVGYGVHNAYTTDVYRYQLLYDLVISQMNTYINYFSIDNSNNYYKLINNFTTKEYNNLILKADYRAFNTLKVKSLSGFEYDPTKFELMRKSTYNVINGLEKTINLVKQNTTLQQEVILLTQNYKDVLEDPIKLNDYINNKKLNVIPFQASQTFETTVELKPWYQRYFQLYGPPGNGVFQAELLAQIVLDLIASGEITEDEFINS